MIDRQPEYEAEVLRHWAEAQDGAHDLGHLRRVWTSCQRIAAGEGAMADAEVLQAAAFFHDLVNLPKDHPDRARASELSAELAADYLRAGGFPPAKIGGVSHAIAAHSFSAGIRPETIEAMILQDADRMEALGAIGVARMFYVAGALGRGMFDFDDPLAERRALDDTRYALDHLEVKLLRLPETMQTETGRAMANERADWLRQFRVQILSELEPSL